MERSDTDRVISGVAGGMAEYFDVDPVLVRVAWVVLCFATAGIALAVYIVMALVMPRHGSSDAEPMEVVTENLEGLAEDASEFAQRLGERRERTRRASHFAVHARRRAGPSLQARPSPTGR